MKKEIKHCSLNFLILFILCITSFMATEAESKGKVRHYATEVETLEGLFPDSTYKKVIIETTQEIQEEITQLMGKNFYDKNLHVYRVTKEDDILAYSFIMNEVGKTKEITFMVSISPEASVFAVNILIFRESQGYEIKNKRWLKQFFSKTKSDRLRVKRGIDNISGATLSARAVTKGVKKALFIYDAIKGDAIDKYFE